jgi:cbb3-type cytochrome oxidase subunit 3
MKQLVLSATDMSIYAEFAVLIFFAIFMGAVYRVWRLTPQRRLAYSECASMVLTDDAPHTNTTVQASPRWGGRLASQQHEEMLR